MTWNNYNIIVDKRENWARGLFYFIFINFLHEALLSATQPIRQLLKIDVSSFGPSSPSFGQSHSLILAANKSVFLFFFLLSLCWKNFVQEVNSDELIYFHSGNFLFKNVLTLRCQQISSSGRVKLLGLFFKYSFFPVLVLSINQYDLLKIDGLKIFSQLNINNKINLLIYTLGNWTFLCMFCRRNNRHCVAIQFIVVFLKTS